MWWTPLFATSKITISAPPRSPPWRFFAVDLIYKALDEQDAARHEEENDTTSEIIAAPIVAATALEEGPSSIASNVEEQVMARVFNNRTRMHLIDAPPPPPYGQKTFIFSQLIPVVYHSRHGALCTSEGIVLEPPSRLHLLGLLGSGPVST